MNKVYLFFFLTCLPLIDMLTSLTIIKHLPISFGSVIRGTILIFLTFVLYLGYQSLEREFFLSFVACFCIFFISFLINLFVKDHFSIMAELNHSLKGAYFVIIIFLIIYLFKLKRIIINPSKIVIFVTMTVGVSFWIAILTNTSFKSYAYSGFGYSGWFFSANELSIIAIILLTLTVIYMRESFDLSWISLLLILSIIPMIGTKSSFIGSISILIFYLGNGVFTYKKEIFYHKKLLFLIGISLIFLYSKKIIFFLYSGEPNSTYLGQELLTNKLGNTDKPFLNFLNKILSSRLLYLENTWKDYKVASFLRKLFGLGYAGDANSQGKTIEMDLFDLFFSYGLIGSVIILIPLVYLLFLSIKGKFTLQTNLLLFTIMLCMGISLTAGHLIFAPSVVSYMLLLYVSLIHLNHSTGEINETKSIS